MPNVTNKVNDNLLEKVYKRTSDKIIFISCEGQVTEEQYFKMISNNIFSEVKSKIQFVSVREDVLEKKEKGSEINEEDLHILCNSEPDQVVKKIVEFKDKENKTYDFKNHPDDEFWAIIDIDHHTDKYNIKKWNEALNICEDEGYGYAVSNPFFEVWLLLHHDDVNDDDKQYAVTDKRSYEKTDHFRKRLEDKGAPLVNAKGIPKKDAKCIYEYHYNKTKVIDAINRAKSLHNTGEKWPQNLGSTVYKLLEKIVDMSGGVFN